MCVCAFVCVLHLPAGTGLRGFSTFSTYTREKRFFIFLEEVLLLLLVPESIDSAVEGSPLRILQVCACDEPLRVVVVCAHRKNEAGCGLPYRSVRCFVYGCCGKKRDLRVCSGARIKREIKESEAESASWFAKLANYCAKI